MAAVYPAGPLPTIKTRRRSALICLRSCARALGEHPVELARCVETRQVLETTDVPLPDPDLRHGRAAGALDHFGAPCGLVLDVHLFPLLALRREQALGHPAVGAPRCRVQEDPGHGVRFSSEVGNEGTDWMPPRHSGSVIGSSSHISCRKVPMKNDMKVIRNTAEGNA